MSTTYKTKMSAALCATTSAREPQVPQGAESTKPKWTALSQSKHCSSLVVSLSWHSQRRFGASFGCSGNSKPRLSSTNSASQTSFQTSYQVWHSSTNRGTQPFSRSTKNTIPRATITLGSTNKSLRPPRLSHQRSDTTSPRGTIAACLGTLGFRMSPMPLREYLKS